MISIASVPETAGLDAALEKPEDRAPGSPVQPAVLPAGLLQETVWCWLREAGCPPAPATCWVRWQPPDMARVGGRVAQQIPEAPSCSICTRDGNNVRNSFSKNF